MQNLTSLPDNLPVPIDDDACSHLTNSHIPSIHLKSTEHTNLNLADIQGWVVIYCYPMTGEPNSPLPTGWNEMPGARGCTAQACSFRDHAEQLKNLNVKVFGLSTQSTEYQTEVMQRLQLPYTLVSDYELEFTKALNLPVFSINNIVYSKCVTLIVFNSIIQHYFYPIFPPDKNAENVIAWLKKHVSIF